MQRENQEEANLVPKENGTNVQQEINVRIKTNLDGCDDEQDFHCSKCNAVRKSKMTYHYGVWTWLCCAIWCFLTFFGGLVPFCWSKCQDKRHQCPQCNTPAGSKEFKPCC